MDTPTQEKQPFATRMIEKFKQKTLLQKIIFVVVVIILLRILFAIISFILQVIRITNMIKSIIYVITSLFDFIIGFV